MKPTEQQINEQMDALRKPGTVQHTGSFYLLFTNKHWYLITTGYTAGPNARQFIQTVHFMNDAGVRKYFSDFTTLEPFQNITDQFDGFEDEVTAKILPNAKDYLPFLESGQILASTGMTTDTISISKIGVRENEFVSALQKIIDTEVVGFCLQFTGLAR
mgnify:CR=1 FL=1